MKALLEEIKIPNVKKKKKMCQKELLNHVGEF